MQAQKMPKSITPLILNLGSKCGGKVASLLSRFSAGSHFNHCIADWISFWKSLDVFEKRNYLAPAEVRNPNPPIPSYSLHQYIKPANQNNDTKLNTWVEENFVVTKSQKHTFAEHQNNNNNVCMT
jgi:hypothetical protein